MIDTLFITLGITTILATVTGTFYFVYGFYCLRKEQLVLFDIVEMKLDIENHNKRIKQLENESKTN